MRETLRRRSEQAGASGGVKFVLSHVSEARHGAPWSIRHPVVYGTRRHPAPGLNPARVASFAPMRVALSTDKKSYSKRRQRFPPVARGRATVSTFPGTQPYFRQTEAEPHDAACMDSILDSDDDRRTTPRPQPKARNKAEHPPIAPAAADGPVRRCLSDARWHGAEPGRCAGLHQSGA